MAAYHSVAELNALSTMWRVRVSILKLWQQNSASGGMTIEMVLIDSNGDKIHGSVKNDLVNQFAKFLAQGITMVLLNFELIPESGSYRTTCHRYKINFLSTSLVLLTNDLPRPLNDFKPVNFCDVLDGTLNLDFLIDVIGHVVELGRLQIQNVNGQEIQKISLLIRDSDDVRLQTVLWGKLATDVSNAIQRRFVDHVILVLRFVKIKVFKDMSALSDAPEGSLMLGEASSQQSGSFSLTPAKRGAPIINLEEHFDQNSVTRQECSIKIKKEKVDKSG